MLLPTHLQWGPKYSLYHVHFDTVYHVPLPEDHLKHPEIFRDLQRAVLQNLGLELQGGRARHLEVLFSERADITMPANHTDLLEDLQRRAPHIRFRTLRFETQNVVSQVREMRAVDVLVGPPGSNLLNLLFMRRGAAVVELMPGGDVVVQRPTWAQQMASIMGLGYRSLDPEVGAERWARHRRQPVFLADSVLDAVKPLVTEFAKTSAAAFEASESMFLSPRLMGCQVPSMCGSGARGGEGGEGVSCQCGHPLPRQLPQGSPMDVVCTAVLRAQQGTPAQRAGSSSTPACQILGVGLASQFVYLGFAGFMLNSALWGSLALCIICQPPASPHPPINTTTSWSNGAFSDAAC